MEKTTLATTQLGLKLLSNLDAADENAVMSPLSIVALLSILYLGANDNNQKELKQLLGHDSVELERQESHEALKAVIDKISDTFKQVNQEHLHHTKGGSTKSGPIANFNIANMLLSNSDLVKLNKTYTDSVSKYYTALIDTFSPKTTNEKALVGRINQWCSDNTNGKITEIIDSLEMDKLALVAANAVHFKAQWAETFSHSNTKPGKFYQKGLEKEAKEVQFMHLEFDNMYAEINNSDIGECQVLGIRFKVDDMMMMFMLPKKRDGLRELVSKLNGKTLQKIMSEMKETKVDVSLPKFKFDQKHDLLAEMKKLGAKDLFEKTHGFRDMFENGTSEAGIDKLLHKALIEIDENGAEAAAVTIAMIYLKAMYMPDPQKPVIFVADHPFLFMIVHTATQMPLFLGRINQL